MENKGLEIKDQLMMFEDQRTSNNKLIILHFIHNEMAYHAKAIEKLSDLYKTIRGLDARQHLKEFADKLNITTVDSGFEAIEKCKSETMHIVAYMI